MKYLEDTYQQGHEELSLTETQFPIEESDKMTNATESEVPHIL